MNLALKQKSDIEHYRNKLRLKAKRKGYYDFPSGEGSNNGHSLVQTQPPSHERTAFDTDRPLQPDDEQGSTYAKSYRRWVESEGCRELSKLDALEFLNILGTFMTFLCFEHGVQVCSVLAQASRTVQ